VIIRASMIRASVAAHVAVHTMTFDRRALVIVNRSSCTCHRDMRSLRVLVLIAVNATTRDARIIDAEWARPRCTIAAIRRKGPGARPRAPRSQRSTVLRNRLSDTP
jgi:hypothetical protein